MAAPSPLWRPFYYTAAQFRDLAPWRWMHDTQFFGIRHPETGETGWCCIMGNAGEHFALAVYRDAAGLHSYFRLAAASDFESEFNPEYFNVILGQDCLMVSFEDAATTPPEIKTHLKSLGLSFRGAGQWIVAQTYDPGMDPWLMEAKDLPWLTLCLEQAMEVAQGYRDNPALLDNDDDILIRLPPGQQGNTAWTNSFIDETELPAEPTAAPVMPSKHFLEQVKFLPELNGAVVLSNFLTPQAVQERKNKRPWHPSVLLCIEPGEGYILSQDMAAYHELPGRLEKFLLGVFKTVKGKPRQIGVHHERMAQWLEKICDAAGIDIILLTGDEPFLTGVVESLSGFMHR